jgi:hypothetical protein
VKGTTGTRQCHIPHHEVTHKRIKRLLESCRAILFKKKVSNPSKSIAENWGGIQKPIVLDGCISEWKMKALNRKTKAGACHSQYARALLL